MSSNYDINESVDTYRRSFTNLFFSKQIDEYDSKLLDILYKQAQLVIHPTNKPIVIRYAKEIYFHQDLDNAGWAMESYARPIHPSLVPELCKLITDYNSLLEGKNIIKSYLVRWFTMQKRTNVFFNFALNLTPELASLANVHRKHLIVPEPILEEWYKKEEPTHKYFQLLLMKNKMTED